MAEKIAKVEGSSSPLPPWGDRPPARPLSPKRRPKTSAPCSNKSIWKHCWRWSSFKTVCSFAVLWTWVLMCYFSSPQPTEGVDGQGPLESMILPDSDAFLNSTAILQDGFDKDFDHLQVESGDVFILSNVSNPRQLENYSAGVQLVGLPVLNKAVPRSPDQMSTDFGVASTARVLMGKVMLEEVGTSWSQAKRCASTATMLSDVTFRMAPSGDAGDAQERPLTYKLHWRAGPIERPLTYKLEWWHGQNSDPAPRPYELRWRQ